MASKFTEDEAKRILEAAKRLPAGCFMVKILVQLPSVAGEVTRFYAHAHCGECGSDLSSDGEWKTSANEATSAAMANLTDHRMTTCKRSPTI